MNPSNNTILITGGGSGIGLALAKRFARAGSDVLISGRRKDVLEAAAHETEGLVPVMCDVRVEEERVRLFEFTTSNYPSLNVLINNAGIQNQAPAFTEPQDWAAHRSEIATNLEAPMHLSMLFAGFLKQRTNAAIVNVTSGLAFVPIARMATYCATKAALHSFTLSLREQLKGCVSVYEVAPPAVKTDLGGPGLHTFGVDLDEYADFAFGKLVEGDLEFGYQFSEAARIANAEERTKLFEAMNSRFRA